MTLDLPRVPCAMVSKHTFSPWEQTLHRDWNMDLGNQWLLHFGMDHYEFKETDPTGHQALELICLPDNSLRKQLAFGNATNGFPAKWHLTHHYQDLGSASDWSNQVAHTVRPIKSTTQIWVVTHQQYGISALISQMSFGGETSGTIAKCWLFSQVNLINPHFYHLNKLRRKVRHA